MPGPLVSMSTNPADDPLRSGPPPPPLRNAPGGSSKSGAGGAGAAHLLGAGNSPVAAVMGDVMEIEKRIRSLSQVRPDIAQVFAQPLAQARDMMAGALADLAQGGTGMPPQDANMPPPGAGAAGPGGIPGGGGAMGGPPPPMPAPMR